MTLSTAADANKGQALHWVVQINYRNRTATSFLIFLAMAWHVAGNAQGTGLEPTPSAGMLAFLAAQFLVVPHLLYQWAKRSPDPLQTEINAMTLDAFSFGVWVAVLEFPLWITFCLWVGVIMGPMAIRGPTGALKAGVTLVVGALAAVVVVGFGFAPHTSLPVSLLVIAAISLYLLLFALDANGRALKLRAIRRELTHSEAALQQKLQEVQSLQDLLTRQVNSDPLTGLYNRRYLTETMGRELARCMREGQALSVLMIDVDHFKAVNDTYGHQAGDAVLAQIAAILAREVRGSDLACCYGGEEFLMLFPNMSVDAAQARAELYRSKAESSPLAFGEFQIRVRLSIGVAGFPGHATTPEGMIECADRALYDAKHQGRNRVVVSQGSAGA